MTDRQPPPPAGKKGFTQRPQREGGALRVMATANRQISCANASSNKLRKLVVAPIKREVHQEVARNLVSEHIFAY